MLLFSSAFLPWLLSRPWVALGHPLSLLPFIASFIPSQQLVFSALPPSFFSPLISLCEPLTHALAFPLVLSPFILFLATVSSFLLSVSLFLWLLLFLCVIFLSFCQPLIFPYYYLLYFLFFVSWLASCFGCLDYPLLHSFFFEVATGCSLQTICVVLPPLESWPFEAASTDCLLHLAQWF